MIRGGSSGTFTRTINAAKQGSHPILPDMRSIGCLTAVTGYQRSPDLSIVYNHMSCRRRAYDSSGCNGGCSFAAQPDSSICQVSANRRWNHYETQLLGYCAQVDSTFRQFFVTTLTRKTGHNRSTIYLQPSTAAPDCRSWQSTPGKRPRRQTLTLGGLTTIANHTGPSARRHLERPARRPKPTRSRST